MKIFVDVVQLNREEFRNYCFNLFLIYSTPVATPTPDNLTTPDRQHRHQCQDQRHRKWSAKEVQDLMYRAPITYVHVRCMYHREMRPTDICVAAARPPHYQQPAADT